MRFLRTNTAVIITVGPFYDKTDGVTIETALTITNERITLTADTDAGSAPTNILDNITGATAATANDLNYITGNDAGLMQLELAAADVNRLGRMFLTITDAANHVPVFHEFMVMPALIYDTFFASSGGATFPAATLASTTNITAAAGCAVSSIGANVVTATAINADAITAAKIADGAIDAATFAAGAINAAAIAADAITDAKVASDVTIASVTGAVGSVTGNVGGNVVGSTASVTAGVTVTTNNDKTGYGLSSAAVQAIWDALTSALTTVGSIGKKLADWTIGTAQTGDTYALANGANGFVAIKAETASILTDTAEIGTAGAGLTNINLPDQTMNIVGNITGNVSGSVGSVTNPVTIGGVNAAGLADFFDTDSGATYGVAVAGSVVKEIADNAGGASLTVQDIRTEIDTNSTKLSAIVADTNELQTDWVNGGRLDLILDARASQASVDDVPTNAELATAFGTADDAVLAAIAALNNLSQANIRTAVGLATANLDTQLDALPTNGELATALAGADDATLAAVAALNNLSSAQVQTAAAAALTAYDPPTRAEATSDKAEIITEVNANETKIDVVDTVVDAIKLKTDNLPTDPADESLLEAAITAATSPLATAANLATAAGFIDTEVAAIKAKTDQFVFTVANQVNSNIQSVNDIEVIGDGGTGTEWGPV